ELKKHLNELGLDQNQVIAALADQAQIAAAVDERPSADERLQNAKQQLQGLLADLGSVPGDRLLTDVDKRTGEKLRQIDRVCHEISNTVGKWNKLKREGRSALPGPAQEACDRISQVCSEKGLFINSAGQLEAMLSELGIEYTTDKRAWIIQAL